MQYMQYMLDIFIKVGFNNLLKFELNENFIYKQKIENM